MSEVHEMVKSITVMGHEFYQMSSLDREAFAGAPKGAWIRYLPDGECLILSPDCRELTEVSRTGEEKVWIVQ